MKKNKQDPPGGSSPCSSAIRETTKRQQGDPQKHVAPRLAATRRFRAVRRVQDVERGAQLRALLLLPRDPDDAGAAHSLAQQR
jgi:hypothetical protein